MAGLMIIVCKQQTSVSCVYAHVIPRLMMCKTVQATPQAGHSVVLESSYSSQGPSGLNGAARRDREVNGCAAGKKAVHGELERLFSQPDARDACMVSVNIQHSRSSINTS